MSFLSAIQLCASAPFRDVTTIAAPDQPPRGFKDTGFPQAIQIVHPGESEPRAIAFLSPNVLAASDVADNMILSAFRYEDVLIITRGEECGALIALKRWDAEFLQDALQWTFESIAYRHIVTAKLVEIFAPEDLVNFLPPILSSVETFPYSLHVLSGRQWSWPWPGMNVQREHALVLLVTFYLGSGHVNPHVPKAYDIWSRNKAVKTKTCLQPSQCRSDCPNCPKFVAFHLQRMGGCPSHFAVIGSPPQQDFPMPIANVFAKKLRMFLSPRETEEAEWEVMNALLASTADLYPDDAEFLPPDIVQYTDDSSVIPDLPPALEAKLNSATLIWPFRDKGEWGIVVAMRPEPGVNFRILTCGARDADKLKPKDGIVETDAWLGDAVRTVKSFLARYSKDWKQVPSNLHWGEAYWPRGRNGELEIIKAEYTLRKSLGHGFLPEHWVIPRGQTLLIDAAWRMAKQELGVKGTQVYKDQKFTIPMALETTLLEWELSRIVLDAAGIPAPPHLNPAKLDPVVWEVLRPSVNIRLPERSKAKWLSSNLGPRISKAIKAWADKYREELSFVPDHVIDFLVESLTDGWLGLGDFVTPAREKVNLTMVQIPLAGDGSHTPFVNLSFKTDGTPWLSLGPARHLEHACAPTHIFSDTTIQSGGDEICGPRYKSLMWSPRRSKPKIYQPHHYGAYNKNCKCKRCLDVESIRELHRHMHESRHRMEIATARPTPSIAPTARPTTLDMPAQRSSDASNTVLERMNKRPLGPANENGVGTAPLGRPSPVKRARVTPAPRASSPAPVTTSNLQQGDSFARETAPVQHRAAETGVIPALGTTSSPVSSSTSLRLHGPPRSRIIDPDARNRLSAVLGASRTSLSNQQHQINALNVELNSLRAQLAASRSENQFLRNWLRRVWMRETNLLKRFGIFAAQALGNTANLYNRYMRHSERDRALAERFFLNGGPTGSGRPVDLGNEEADNSEANASDDEEMAAQLANGYEPQEGDVATAQTASEPELRREQEVAGGGNEEDPAVLEKRWEREDRDAAARGKGKGRGSGNRRGSDRRQ